MRSATFNISLSIVLALILAACNQAPSPEIQETKSVEAAGKPPHSEEHSSSVQIFYAQTGIELTQDNKIKNPGSAVRLAQDFFALGVFKGVDEVDSSVKLRIVDQKGELVHQLEQSFRPSGENSVLFQINAKELPLQAGQYRIFFDLNGVPCWELPITVG